MHAYVFKRTQAYLGGAQVQGQGDTSEGYPARRGATNPDPWNMYAYSMLIYVELRQVILCKTLFYVEFRQIVR